MTLLVCIKPKVWNLLPMTPIEALRYGSSSPTGRFFRLPVLSECCHNFEMPADREIQKKPDLPRVECTMTMRLKNSHIS
jgi:hypothetical protein